MKIYIIKGDHPTFRYVNLIANGEKDLHDKMHELLTNGYKITIELQTTKQARTVKSMGDILRSAIVPKKNKSYSKELINGGYW